MSPPAHVVLVAHGSRDPRSAATVRALARSVAVARPDVVVHDAYLDFDAPRLSTLLLRLRDHHVVVVPLLLSAAYHARTDIPAIVEVARAEGGRVDVAEVLVAPCRGGFELIVSGLRRRLREAVAGPPLEVLDVAGLPVDALVLGAAGTRDPQALASIDEVAAALGRSEGLHCVAGYASGAGRPITDALAYLSARGAQRIGIASYFLAPGLLHDRIVSAKDQLSAVTARGQATCAPITAAPLGDTPEIVAITSRRIDQCLIASEALV